MPVVCPWCARPHPNRKKTVVNDRRSFDANHEDARVGTTRHCYCRRSWRGFHSHSCIRCEPPCRECLHCRWHYFARRRDGMARSQNELEDLTPGPRKWKVSRSDAAKIALSCRSDSPEIWTILQFVHGPPGAHHPPAAALVIPTARRSKRVSWNHSLRCQPPDESAADCIINGRADSAHNFIIHATEWPLERALKNGVKAVAIDDRRLVNACVVVVEFDLGCKAPY